MSEETQAEELKALAELSPEEILESSKASEELPVEAVEAPAEALGSVSEFIASVTEVESSPKYEFGYHSFEILAESSDGFHLAKREDGVECEIKLEDDKIVKIKYS